MDSVLNRKLQHIRLSLRDDVVYEDRCKPFYSEIVLVHQAFPGLKLDDVDLKIEFLGYEIEAPILIEAMTGGISEAKGINRGLAELASKHRIAIGLGSHKPIIASKFNPEVIGTYRIVREVAMEVPVLGNIGITQLLNTSIDDILYAMEVVGVDAIAVHLNPAQEIIQPEGDRDFGSEILSKFRELLKKSSKPVLIKEVGHGLSMEAVNLFSSLGVRIFDVAGACGTSWVKIEALRCSEHMPCYHIGNRLYDEWWGIPTPISVVEARFASRSSQIIASGGVWDGIKAAKMLALGANMVGLARPLLKVLLEQGVDGAHRFLEQYILELKTIMFLVGASKPSDLCRAPLILGNTVASYLSARGINVKHYVDEVRCLRE